MSDKKLQMKVDMNIIQHLGISMYATLPPVIAELISNAYDADASEVTIELFDNDPENKKIIVKDNGTGMSVEEIQDAYLVIGRNRRKQGDVTGKGRKVIGRKGIGKLSIFGIADEIIVTSVKNINGKNIKNRFKLNLNDIRNAGTLYHPPHEIVNQITDEPHGTIIEINKIRRKSSFNKHQIAVDLSRRFTIFDESFKVFIKHNNSEPEQITQDLRFEGIDIEFKWNFPHSELRSEYKNKDKVKGIVYTAKKPVPEDIKGIYLVVRGKIVHRNDFYGIRASDYAHAYLTGWLEVDFIDDNAVEDNISTNRQELTWEKEDLQELKNYLQEIISFVTSSWRKERKKSKEDKIRKKTSIDIVRWLEFLDSVSKPIANKLVNFILDSENIDEERSSEIISYIHEMFEFDSFRQMAADIVAEESIKEGKLLELMKKWELVEAREMYKLSKVRIDTIKNFEKLIQEETKEVPTMHNFFKKFPWLLDPRIMEFKDEITYSKILKERYPEIELSETNRRIDFLCNKLVNTLFVIELKRPRHTLMLKDLEQVEDYLSFLKERYTGNSPESPSEIQVYLITGEISEDRKIKLRLDALKSQKIYVKLYHELLSEAKNYHQEFIDNYMKIERSDGHNTK